MSTLCDTCLAFPWQQLNRERKFRYAWWKKESLQVPSPDLTSLSERREIVHSPVVQSNREHDRKNEEFIYYKEIGEVERSSAHGCHICRLVWKGFIEYSMDEFGSDQKKEAIMAFSEKTSTRIQILHKAASGELEFCFRSEAICRTVMLRYYFVSRKYICAFLFL